MEMSRKLIAVVAGASAAAIALGVFIFTLKGIILQV
jgi:hypothetical protein